MRVIVAGGTGFIGQALCRRLIRNGYGVDVVSRDPSKVQMVYGPQARGVAWSLEGADGLGRAVEDAAGVVNLAGESIEGRWGEAKKQRIRESRISAVEAVVQAVSGAERPPQVLLQGSAVGYYGPRGRRPVDESAEVGEGFLADTARQWEQASAGVESRGVRRVLLRTGMVLGPGGALARMLPIFRLGLGGPIGSGRQMISWIHIEDEVGAMLHLLENPSASGPYNLTAPQPVSNREFSKTLGRVLSRPAVLPLPSFAARLMFGQMADEVLLSGQAAQPAGLEASGYAFSHPRLDDALQNAVAAAGCH
jgi:hypothetical protein